MAAARPLHAQHRIAAPLEQFGLALAQRQQALVAGRLLPFAAPLLDNTGKEVLKKDEVADDKFLGGVNFYVKSVEGKIPGGE